MHRLVCLLVLAGCPAPSSRYVVADVTAARVPLQGALVAADCGTAYNPAQRTGEDGRARVRVWNEDSRTCSLIVAKPGYPTVETGPVNVCPAGACAPARIDLAASSHETTFEPAPTPVTREYAQPTGRRALEVAQ
jgi:hypothetical protein